MRGRLDDMLSIRGSHVYPAAIEDVVRRVREISEAYEVLIETRDGQDAVTVRCEPRVGTSESDWPKVAEAVVREVSSALEVKVNVDLKPYGTVTREFKAKRIHDMRKG